MLVPAIVYKDKIEAEFSKRIYDDDFFFYAGYGHGHEIPTIQIQDNQYQFAILDTYSHLVGFFAYYVSDSYTAQEFELYSFDKGNPVVTTQVYREMCRIVHKYRRITWRVIEGNPVAHLYSRFCHKYRGRVHYFRDVTRTDDGKFCGEYVYEILKSDWSENLCES